MGGARAAARARRWVRSGPLIALALVAPAEAAPALVELGRFESPTHATGDASRVYVTERAGRLRAEDGSVRLDLTAITQTDHSERGLLSAAFGPDGRVYVFLTVTAAAAVSGTPGELQVREYRAGSDPRVLLSVRHDAAGNHNGGQLQFGPDGMLWLATGDGAANAMDAQDPASLLGKVIRIDTATGAHEVLARGLRNPWRFSFAPDGRIVIADVGASAVEEVNVGLAANYGWPCWEGTLQRSSDPACASGTAPPVLEQPRSTGFCAITGGYVVRDPGLPTLLGRYLYGDFCNAALRSVDLADVGTDAPVGLSVPALSSFGEDACGRLLVVSLSGPVYRLVDGAPSACGASDPPPEIPVDTRACTVSARVTGLRSVHRLRRLSVALRTDEACRATVSARIRGVAFFRSATRSLVPGQRTVVRVRLTARGTRAVRRALDRRRSLRAAVRVRAVDTAGNVSSLTRSVRVRRAAL